MPEQPTDKPADDQPQHTPESPAPTPDPEPPPAADAAPEPAVDSAAQPTDESPPDGMPEKNSRRVAQSMPARRAADIRKSATEKFAAKNAPPTPSGSDSGEPGDAPPTTDGDETDEPDSSEPASTPERGVSARLTALRRKSEIAQAADSAPASPAETAIAAPATPVPAIIWPIAAMILSVMVVAGIGMHLSHTPIIPFVVLGFVCISCWEYKWARTMWYAVLITYALWLAVHTTPIWLPFFFGLVFAYILSPLVDWGEAILIFTFRSPERVARPVAVVMLFVVAFGLFVALDAVFISNVVETAARLQDRFSGQNFEQVVAANLNNLLTAVNWEITAGSETSQQLATALGQINAQVGDYSEQNLESLLGTAGRTLGYMAAMAIDMIIVAFVTFYLLLDFPKLSEKVQSYFSPARSRRLNKLSREMSKILRQYLQGHSLVCLCVALIYYFVLLAFGHEYAPLLAVVMGVFTFIPFVGPIMAGVVSVVVTLTVDQNVGQALLAVVVGYILCQGSNDLILYPLIAGRSVKLHPVTSLLVLFLIGHSFGIVGMFFAVPIAAMARTAIDWMNEEHIPGFEWLKLLRPYEIRHARTLMLQREVIMKRASGMFGRGVKPESPSDGK